MPLPKFPPLLRRPRSAACVALALLLAAPPAPAADVWRWIDERGAVHFGDRPATGDAERLKVTPPTPSGSDRQRHERTRRLIETFATEREERRDAWAAARAETDQRKRRCEQARAEQQRRETATHLYYRDADGTKRIVEGAEYDAALQESRDAVREWCA